MVTSAGGEYAALRARLKQEADRLERRLADSSNYGLDDAQRGGIGELSAYDNHPGDIGTETFERGKDAALLENDELRLRRMREALQAMDDGSYGICRTCGEPIPRERLEAVPETLYCVRHSPQRHESKQRPVEEQLLNPPFGRTSLDEQSSWTAFDGEDAWQIAEASGTSDSPAMAEDPEADYEQLTIEADEQEGFVEKIEQFLATDITGRQVSFVRSRAYREYVSRGEGDPLFEPDPSVSSAEDLETLE